LAGLIFWRKKKEDRAQVSEPVVVEPVEEVVETVVAPVVIEPEVVETVVVEEPVLEAVELPKRRFSGGIKSLFSRIKFDLENLN